MLVNLYGPTEAAIDVSVWRCDPESPLDCVPIGTPIANTELYILDHDRRLLPVGAAGELYIGGVCLARGYLGRPALTAERFVPHPFRPGQRLYRTGDRCRFLPDGNIEYLGRLDHQVKLRGLRIELGEIEARLRAHAAVREAAVVLRDDLATPQLVAYLVPTPGQTLSEDDLRAHLAAELPAYMVPAMLMHLDALPLTPSGKLDRKALPAPDQAASQPAFAPPRTDTERVLCALVAQLLAAPQVGIHDNFFALGGDSILGLQLIAQARTHGIALTPKQLFQQRTMAELALVAGSANAVQAEQGLLAGELPLLPIQRWLLDQALAAPQHWNQSVLLVPRARLTAAYVRATLRCLTEHHDALRLRFCRDHGRWRQIYGDTADTGTGNAFALDTLHLAQGDALAEHLARFAAALDFTHGPLFRAVLVELPDETQRLYLVAHHLVVDAVSWRILLEDFADAYDQIARGEPPHLPAKSSSYRQWALRLVRHADSAALAAQRDYWHAQAGTEALPAPLPVDTPSADNLSADEVSLVDTLSAKQTRELLHDALAAYRSQVQELLLTALAQVLCEWTGDRAALVDVEGHGREGLFSELDVSRTVGWFTSLYPVRLQLAEAHDAGAYIKAVKEQLRAVPEHGLGYGVLRYLAGETLPGATGRVLFNYLGRIDGNDEHDGSRLLTMAPEPTPADRAGANARTHELEIVAAVIGGALQVEWRFSGKRYRQATQQRLLARFMDRLRALIHHCLASDAGTLTPSDFPLARKLDQASLDRLLRKLPSTMDPSS